MSEIFVISDTHFGHENIIKYCDRPFNDYIEMDEHIIRKWNNIVSPQDKVYHLGDVYMGKSHYCDEILHSLNGKKRLILGNHDNGKDQVLLRHFQKIVVWRMFPEFGLLLTHVPVHQNSLRKNGRNDAPDCELTNIHGHIHNNPSPEGPYRNVSVEVINYTPINIEELRVK